MIALILNSGVGKRMGELTKCHPKGMTVIGPDNMTILKRQLLLLAEAGIEQVVMTTGPMCQEMEEYCKTVASEMSFSFVHNPLYETTNYIYSMYLAKDHLDDDILLMHGDLVFEKEVLTEIIRSHRSSVVVRMKDELPEKDFKAELKNSLVKKIGINVFENAVALFPLYRLERGEWRKWMSSIVEFCEKGTTSCYAEDAFNAISSECEIHALATDGLFCMEIDNPSDLEIAMNYVRREQV
jgi:Predicted sugar nucleotidyltransferases